MASGTATATSGATAVRTESGSRATSPAPGPRASRHPARTRRPASAKRRNDVFWAAVFITPTLLGLLVFYLWPVVRTPLISFTETGPFGGSQWVGLDNYTKLFGDARLWETLLNTLKFTVVALLGIPIALVVAALLSTEGLRGVKVYRVLYFLPVVTMPAAVGLIWRTLYNGDVGVINAMLHVVGIQGTNWLSNPDTALYAIAGVGIWLGLGTQIVIFLAAIQGVPKELYEAAALDGAGRIRQFWSITLPTISPSVFFISVLAVIGALQTFDLIFVMSGPTNPAYPETETIVAQFYQRGFVENQQGYAAAIALVILVIIVAVTALQFRLQKKWVHYV
ncbi:sugar ABC transporter permease [Intrasporangium sp. YIM S08009]|uniref:carbohydrate ABC transporter permease n=1 Tax=Intrasporangium zincisolvens TaxID=3080018 RepID=UPI002B058BBE|nr:sugar ABC transporter permease [Intrasporangium sp. YIM S08009]